MLAGDDCLMISKWFKIGDVFISHSQQWAQEVLEEAKKNLQEEIDALESRLQSIQWVLDLEVQSYAKFGSNINLEADESWTSYKTLKICLINLNNSFVIIKYWLYSLSCTVYFYNLFIWNIIGCTYESPTPILPLPSFLSSLVAINLFSFSVTLLYFGGSRERSMLVLHASWVSADNGHCHHTWSKTHASMFSLCI